jgi:hypothetical protein
MHASIARRRRLGLTKLKGGEADMHNEKKLAIPLEPSTARHDSRTCGNFRSLNECLLFRIEIGTHLADVDGR